MNLTKIYREELSTTPRDNNLHPLVWLKNNEIHYLVPQSEEYFALLIPESRKENDHYVAPFDILVILQLKLLFNSHFLLGPDVAKKYWMLRHPSIKKYTLSDKLFDYQKDGVSLLIKFGNSILADPPGAGKTAQAIQAFKDYKKVLIICPSILKSNWGLEIKSWSSLLSFVVDGNAEERSNIINGYNEGCLIIGFEVLRLHPELKDIKFDWIVIDEAHRIKDKYAQQTISCKELISAHKIAITGTPIINNLGDLFSILSFIDPVRFSKENEFLSYYDESNDFKSAQLENLLSRYVIRRPIESLPILTKTLPLNFTQVQSTLYQDMKKYSRSVLGSKNITAVNVFSQILRLRQFTCSPIILGFDEPGSKLTAINNIIDAYDSEKFVIFTTFASMANLINQSLSNSLLLIGDVPKNKRDIIIEKYNKESNSVLITTYSLGGAGLNLQSGSNVILVDKPWTPALLEQAIGRVNRIGQENEVIVYDLFIKDSIDERINSVLYNKEVLIDKVNNLIEIATLEGIV